MSAEVTGRNARLRRRREKGASLRVLGRDFRISDTQVRRILIATGGDPLRAEAGADLRGLSLADLARERDRLRDRIASDRRRLRIIDDELVVRRTDRLLGLAG